MINSIFCDFITVLNERNIRYCIVGITDHYPNDITGDVDFVIHPDDLEAYRVIIKAFPESHPGALHIQRFQHDAVAFCDIFVCRKSDGYQSLRTDLCTHYIQNVRLLLRAEEILENRRLAVDETGKQKSFYIPAPENNFIYYLVKKIGKQACNAVQVAHLKYFYGQAPEACKQKLEKFWSFGEVQSQILEFVQTGNLALFEKHAGTWLNIMRSGTSIPLRIRVAEYKRYLYRGLHPTGLVVRCNQSQADIEALKAALFCGFNLYFLYDGKGKISLLSLLKKRISSALILVPDGIPCPIVDIDVSGLSVPEATDKVFHYLADRMKHRLNRE